SERVPRGPAQPQGAADRARRGARRGADRSALGRSRGAGLGEGRQFARVLGRARGEAPRRRDRHDMDVVTRSARPCAGVRRNPSGRGIASSRVWVLAGSLAMGCSPAASPGGPAPAAATAPPAPERTPTVAERLEAILDADLRARPVYATQ